MKIFLKNIFKEVGVISIICFVGLLVVNKVLFTDIHKLEDESIIIFVHPDKAENKNLVWVHHYIKTDIFFSQNLDILFFFITTLSFFQIGLFSFQTLIQCKNLYDTQHISLYIGRPPPYR